MDPRLLPAGMTERGTFPESEVLSPLPYVLDVTLIPHMVHRKSIFLVSDGFRPITFRHDGRVMLPAFTFHVVPFQFSE